MSESRQLRRPLLIIITVLVVDVTVRVVLQFQMNRVVLVETGLFGTAALVLIWPDTRNESLSRLEMWLAVIFGLGSLRAGLWSAGLSVGVANLVVLGVGVLAVIGFVLRRRRRGKKEAI